MISTLAFDEQPQPPWQLLAHTLVPVPLKQCFEHNTNGSEMGSISLLLLFASVRRMMRAQLRLQMVISYRFHAQLPALYL